MVIVHQCDIYCTSNMKVSCVSPIVLVGLPYIHIDLLVNFEVTTDKYT